MVGLLPDITRFMARNQIQTHQNPLQTNIQLIMTIVHGIQASLMKGFAIQITNSSHMVINVQTAAKMACVYSLPQHPTHLRLLTYPQPLHILPPRHHHCLIKQTCHHLHLLVLHPRLHQHQLHQLLIQKRHTPLNQQPDNQNYALQTRTVHGL